MQKQTQKQAILEAVESDSMTVHYQPKYCAKTGRVFAAEALVRYDGCSPAIFIPVVEKAGLLWRLTQHVLRIVCADLRCIRILHGEACKISVNLTPALLLNEELPSRVSAILGAYAIPPSMVEFEITETEAIVDYSVTLPVLAALRAQGHDLALDDFGVGFSGLLYLDMLPVTTLKIDRHFARGIGVRSGSERLLAHIVGMAEGMGLNTVIEGVETITQLRRSVDLGVDEIQGFLLGHPAPFEDFLQRLVAAGVHPSFSRQVWTGDDVPGVVRKQIRPGGLCPHNV